MTRINYTFGTDKLGHLWSRPSDPSGLFVCASGFQRLFKFAPPSLSTITLTAALKNPKEKGWKKALLVREGFDSLYYIHHKNGYSRLDGGVGQLLASFSGGQEFWVKAKVVSKNH